jgi:tetratricopeptide (TPR) repeat protein
MPIDALTHFELGKRKLASGEAEQARKHFRRAAAIQCRLAEIRPDDLATLKALATAYACSGIASYGLLETDQARLDLQRALNLYRRIPSDHCFHRPARLGAALAYHWLGKTSFRAGKFPHALEYFYVARDIRLGLVESEPENLRLGLDLGRTYDCLGHTILKGGNFADGRHCFEQELNLCLRLAQLRPQSRRIQHNLAHAYAGIGTAELRLGDPDKAWEFIQKAAHIYRRISLRFDSKSDDADIDSDL